ncbi:Ubiquitin-like superfamily protein [Euphorbia peplus]|nr:Ubiquitin-like superfamily protein [Euphorbia peplus]
MSVVDMRIDIDNYSPRFASTPRRSVSLPSFPAISGRSRRRGSFIYAQLPEEPLRLSILKLDGSCFDIQIMKTATVAELRIAVEDAFSYMPRKGPGKISWPHVWSHFCLTYDGRKLVVETDYIRNYGIRDGDQLQFIRHISNSFSLKMKKKRSSKHIAASEPFELPPLSPDIYEEIRRDDSFCDVENGFHHIYDEIDNSLSKKETRLATFFHFNRWLSSYSRMSTMERSLKGYSSTTSAFSILGSFRKVLELCNDKHYYQKPRYN